MTGTFLLTFPNQTPSPGLAACLMDADGNASWLPAVEALGETITGTTGVCHAQGCIGLMTQS